MKWLLWLAMIVLTIPLLGVFYFASSGSGGIGAAFVAAAHDPVLLSASQNSAIVSIISAAMSTLTAFLLRTRQLIGAPGRQSIPDRLITVLFIAPVAIPDLFLAIIYASGLTMWHIPSGLVPLVAAYLVTGVPLAFLLLGHLENPSLTSSITAARDLGSPPRVILLRILWPLSRGVLAGCMALFTLLYLNEFVIAFFLLGPGQATIPVVFYSALRFGVGPKIYATSTLIITLSIVVGVILSSRQDTTRPST